MKIVFHENFNRTDYASDGASARGRMESIMKVLVEEGRYEVVLPDPASSRDISRAHSKTHIASIAKDTKLFEMALLAAGGAISASEIAFKEDVDIVAVSAGFDSYKEDVGKKLTTFDFYLIGRLMKKFAKRMGHKRRFAILEDGYYLPDLGKNVLAFCQGFE
ncbi:hypothetical protein ES705_08069 [subsurface metagenome]|nr:hypothetical protein [Methanosarcinales archaeon]